MEAVKTEICLSEASLFPFSLQQTALAQPGAVLIFASFHQGKEGATLHQGKKIILKQDKLSNSKGKNNLIHPKLVNKIRNVLSEPFVFPDNILNKLQADPTVWNNYQQFSDTYKRIRIAYIQAAEIRPEEFEKRLNNFSPHSTV